MIYDAIIIGKGPAGIQAALHLTRANRNVLVIGKDRGALEKGATIENYYGFPNPIDGKELIDRGVTQAQNLGVNVISDEVISLVKYSHFTVKTTAHAFEGKTVLLATGKSRISLKVPGFETFKGKGISFCAVCDGYIFKSKKIGIIGHNAYMLSELDDLKQFSQDITVFTNGHALSVDVGDVTIVTDPIESFNGTTVLTSIKTTQATYDLNAAFIALGTPSATDFAIRLGVFTTGTDIDIDDQFMTNLDGLYAAGDCIGGWPQIAKAVSDGAHAARAMNKALRT